MSTCARSTQIDSGAGQEEGALCSLLFPWLSRSETLCKLYSRSIELSLCCRHQAVNVGASVLYVLQSHASLTCSIGRVEGHVEVGDAP